MRKEIKYLCVVMIVLVIAAVAMVLGCRSGKSRDEIDRTVQKYAPTGASVAIIEYGEIKEIRNYGYADKEERKPVTDQTRFKIASISKTVTSYAVMQLVEQGKLDLDVPVNQYLTRWKIPQSEYEENKVTLRMLLSHTAGLTGSNEFGYTMPLPGIDEALRMQNVRLKREPGVQFEYSEFVGHGICQLVIEEVTGMRFEEYMVTQVFEPLGMNHTDYANQSNEKGELAVPYAGPGEATEVVPIVMNGAGGVTTTSYDLAVFELELMKYYANGCGEMFREQENTQSAGGTYALGIIPRKLSDGRVVYEHNGTLTGWNAQLVIEPISGNGIAVVSNSDKAYYMTYELMEVWSRKAFGEKVSDSLMKSIKHWFRVIKYILLFCIMSAAIIMMIHFSKHHYVSRTGHIRTGLSIFIFLFLIINDGMVFYTDWIFKILWGMDNYYLFTFFPPDFGAIQIEAVILLIMILIRLNIKKHNR